MKGYKFLEHTADIMVEVWGDSLNEAFEAAGTAFYDIILNVKNIEQKINYKIETTGFDIKSLLYNWIEELILIFEIESLVFKDFKVNIGKKDKEEEYYLVGEGYGERYDREKHGFKVHVKAITYHQMEIWEKDGRHYIRFVVDI
jgi:SHS2 domain-containing protein